MRSQSGVTVYPGAKKHPPSNFLLRRWSPLNITISTPSSSPSVSCFPRLAVSSAPTTARGRVTLLRHDYISSNLFMKANSIRVPAEDRPAVYAG